MSNNVPIVPWTIGPPILLAAAEVAPFILDPADAGDPPVGGFLAPADAGDPPVGGFLAPPPPNNPPKAPGTFANLFPKNLKGARASLVAVAPIFAANPITERIMTLNPILIAATAPTAYKIFLRTVSLICSNFSLFPSSYALRASIP